MIGRAIGFMLILLMLVVFLLLSLAIVVFAPGLSGVLFALGTIIGGMTLMGKVMGFGRDDEEE